MRTDALLLWTFSLSCALAGCIGGTGPNLPADVGSNHPTSGGQRGGEEDAEPPGEPVPVGTAVWANYHDSGFFFHGMVVERRGDQMHRVIYDDGASEWMPANSLLPDSLSEEAHVHVRERFEGEFQAAIVGRRLGRALYVRLANGNERWTVLPHVRFQANDENVPHRGDSPRAPVGVSAPEVGSDVLVNYQMQGLRFPGTVTANREGRQLHIVYLDGETEWTDPALVAAETIEPGTIVHVRRSWQPATWVRGRVQQRMGAALQIEFDDGGSAWTSLFRIRVPVDEAADVTSGEQPVLVEPPPEPPPVEEPRPRRRPRRRAPAAEQPQQ